MNKTTLSCGCVIEWMADEHWKPGIVQCSLHKAASDLLTFAEDIRTLFASEVWDREDFQQIEGRANSVIAEATRRVYQWPKSPSIK